MRALLKFCCLQDKKKWQPEMHHSLALAHLLQTKPVIYGGVLESHVMVQTTLKSLIKCELFLPHSKGPASNSVHLLELLPSSLITWQPLTVVTNWNKNRLEISHSPKTRGGKNLKSWGFFKKEENRFKNLFLLIREPLVQDGDATAQLWLVVYKRYQFQLQAWGVPFQS